MGFLVLAGFVYVAVGLGLVRGLVRDGIPAIVPEATGSTRGFRWIITPGVVLLWPLVRRRAQTADAAGKLRGSGVDPVDEEAR